ncbi:MAG TPA: endonuclease domain-containing protein [Halanaerobiales bacterium]|nr:endonuclease domain-containing protein [Halanaerobiales bacterium]
MTLHYNRNSEKKLRKTLRHNSTEAEEKLWQQLRNRKLLGLKFKRQYSVDQFVLDFYCSQLKLAIEVDGKIHLNKEVREHDENREGYLKDFGIKILRITNEKVLEDMDGALELIKREAEELLNTAATSTSPKSSGDVHDVSTSPKSSPYKGEDF